ncbi:MAG: rRNA pseudouridine synthase [Phycisphaerales bacterium]|nr:rRNA pseudouridine synthase [Phycisphaerales bacterium]
MSDQDLHTSSDPAGRVRLQRFLADAGVAARRACEALIEAGRVTVNGEVRTRLPVFVNPETDRVAVDGTGIRGASRHLYIMLNKPTRTIVAAADDPNFSRRTVLDLVDHPAAARLFPVGRMDFDCTGLVILTNDGGLANRLTHPRYGVTKTYRVLVRGDLDDAALAAIRAKLRGGLAALREGGPERGGADLSIVKREEGRTLLEVVSAEGPSRGLRDVLRYLGMPVKRIERTAIGELKLRALGLGQWRELTRDEVRLLKGQGDAGTRTRQKPKNKPRRERPAGPRRPDSGPTAAPGGRRGPARGGRPGGLAGRKGIPQPQARAGRGGRPGPRGGPQVAGRPAGPRQARPQGRPEGRPADRPAKARRSERP